MNMQMRHNLLHSNAFQYSLVIILQVFLQQYSLGYSDLCQTSKLRKKTLREKTLFPLKIFYFFISRRRELGGGGHRGQLIHSKLLHIRSKF